MKLVDVHCHLNHQLFKDDIQDVIQRAKTAGVQAILVSGVNPAANRDVLQFCKQDPILKASLGIYPIDALGLTPDETGLPHHTGPIDLEQQFQFFKDNLDQIQAIGEIGMDFYWAEKNTKAQQQENFIKIIKFAKEVDKPIVIHSRKAEEECLDVLEKHQGDLKVIQHSFSGRKALMTRAIELGHYFSIPPNIIKASNFQTLVKKAPLSQLLTETDAPWLSHDKNRNEPANVIHTIQKIADIKGLTPEEIADQIWKNYETIFLS